MVKTIGFKTLLFFIKTELYCVINIGKIFLPVSVLILYLIFNSIQMQLKIR